MRLPAISILNGFSSFFMDTSPIELGPHSYDLTLIISLKTPSPNIVTMEGRASTYTFRGDTIQSITGSISYAPSTVYKTKALSLLKT